MIRCRLKYVLLEKGVTQSMLASKLHFQLGTINKLANDRKDSVSFELMDKICKELNCTPGDLFEYILDNEDKCELKE